MIANSAELKKLREEAMVEQRFNKSTRAVAMNRRAAPSPQDDAHAQPATGQMLSTSPSIATPTPDVDDVSSAKPHSVAATAAPGGMRDPFGCPPVSFMESAFEMIGSGSPEVASHWFGVDASHRWHS